MYYLGPKFNIFYTSFGLNLIYFVAIWGLNLIYFVTFWTKFNIFFNIKRLDYKYYIKLSSKIKILYKLKFYWCYWPQQFIFYLFVINLTSIKKIFLLKNICDFKKNYLVKNTSDKLLLNHKLYIINQIILPQFNLLNKHGTICG